MLLACATSSTFDWTLAMQVHVLSGLLLQLQALAVIPKYIKVELIRILKLIDIFRTSAFQFCLLLPEPLSVPSYISTVIERIAPSLCHLAWPWNSSPFLNSFIT